MSEEKKDNNTSCYNNENVVVTTTTTTTTETDGEAVMGLPSGKSTESLNSNPTASKLKAPLSFSNLSAPPSRIGRLCSQHPHPKPSESPPPTTPRESIMNRESSSPSSTTYTDLYQETVRQFTRSSLSPEMDRNSPSRMSMKSRTSRMSNNTNDLRDSYDLYIEATGRRRSSDHGAVLTADTEQFIIGQRVWVGGIRPGQIAYIGETHFAPGDWAGVVLDDPNGKNDGCVAGKRYFQCEPKRGIFSRLTRLTMTPMSGANTPTAAYGKFSPERSMTISPTASLRSSVLRSPTKNGLTVGDRVIVSSGFGSRPGILRYLGETQFASGNWCGVELDEPSGKNDGSVDGIRYFDCKAKYGVFVPIAKVSLSPLSKKTRLSRAGSRESLTSIGTMNSIATTNTSRMRMNAQRKLSTTSTKHSSVPKAQFSMQDLLRDKQNHVEQLMIERDLDREDAQNQALNFQKTINELKLRINQLEVLLSDERKKTEDLQFSIDEATFCGDEYSAESQYFKEKIHKLEQKLKKKEDKGSTQAIPESESTAALNAQILQLTAALDEQTVLVKKYEKDMVILEDDLKQRQSSIEFLQNENVTLLKELRDKDENLEKFTLSESGLNNMQKEMLLLKQEYENERKTLEADYAEKLHAAQENVRQLTEDMAQARIMHAQVDAECLSLRSECDAIKLVCDKQKAELQGKNDEMQKLCAESIMLRAENSTLDEMLKSLQQTSNGSQTTLESQIAEIGKLKQEIGKLIETKTNMEINLKSMEQQVVELKEAKTMLETQLQQIASTNHEQTKSMQFQLEELQHAVLEKDTKIQTLTSEIEKMRRDMAEAQNTIKSDEISLLQHRDELSKLKEQQKQEVSSMEHLKTQVKEQSALVSSKQLQIEELTTQMAQQKETVNMLQNESSTVVNELTEKLKHLQKNVSELQQKLQTKEEELVVQQAEHKQKALELAAKSAQLETLATANETNDNLLVKIRQEYDDNQEQLQLLNQRFAELQDKLQQEQLQLEDSNSQLAASVSKFDTLSVQHVALQKQHASLEEQSNRLQQELKVLQELLQSKESQQHETDAQRLRYEASIEEYQQKLKNVSNQMESLDINCKKLEASSQEKQQLVVELQEKSVQQELTISDIKRQLENIQAKYDSLQAEKLSLQEDLLSVRTSSTDTSVEIVKLTDGLRASQEAYETLLDKSNLERAALESEVEANRQKIDALCKQIETLTQELKTVTTDSLQCKQDLQAEQSKCEKLTLDVNDLQRRLEVQTQHANSLETERSELQIKLKHLSEKCEETQDKLRITAEEFAVQKQVWQETQIAQKDEIAGLHSQLIANDERLKQLGQEKETNNLEFVRSKNELEAASKKQLEERTKVINNLESHIKTLEQTKQRLDEAVVNMQSQIKLLQDELLKSQLDFKSKEDDMSRQLKVLAGEKQQLQLQMEGLQNSGEKAQVELSHEKSALAGTLQQLKDILAQRDSQLEDLRKNVDNLAAEKQELLVNITTMERDVNKLREELEYHKTEMEHRSKLSETDKQKINELKELLEAMRISNGKISATNAELSATLAQLEQEKFETAHIFEIFEMESDQNAQQLLEKLSNMKEHLAETQKQLLNKETELTVSQKSLQSISLELQNSQSQLKEAEAQLHDIKLQLQDSLAKQQELQTFIEARDANLEANSKVLLELEEYKKIVEELSDAADANSAGVQEKAKDYKLMEQTSHQHVQVEKQLKTQYVDLQRKYESMEAEKLREIKSLQERIKDLQLMAELKQNGRNTNGDSSLLGDDNTAQINFLNSIIADMQKKNDTLKAKIEALEMLPTDFTKPKAFDFVTKRKPAPRVFCDICDEFDKHETEDCPLQASEDFDNLPLLKANTDKERTLPEPRKYCESCEVFGHDTGECGDECF